MAHYYIGSKFAVHTMFYIGCSVYIIFSNLYVKVWGSATEHQNI